MNHDFFDFIFITFKNISILYYRFKSAVVFFKYQPQRKKYFMILFIIDIVLKIRFVLTNNVKIMIYMKICSSQLSYSIS